MITRSLVVVVAALVVAGCVAPNPNETEDSALTTPGLVQVTSFGSNPGGLRMWKYVPAAMPSHAALVVALHACTEQAADYTKAGWNAMADQYKFYVLYPEQTTTNNAITCFNWAGSNTDLTTGQNDVANLTRGMGENQSIKEMIDKMKADHGIDASRVFVTGLSAGGAQTALLLAVWPDVFAGGASFAGIPYYCTTNRNQVSTCLNPGIPHTAKEWGDLVRKAYGGYTGPWPRISIWQGTKDSVVNPANQVELMKQWTDVHGIAQTPSATDTVVTGVTRDVYRDGNGVAVVQVYKVANLDHGVPVDPKSGCGTAAQYIIDDGICAAYLVAHDWGLTGDLAPGDGGSGGMGGGGGAGGSGGGGGNGGGGGGTGGSGGGGNGAGGGGKPLPCGCSAVGGARGSIANVAPFALLGLLARRKRANSSAWTRCSGLPSSSRKRA